MGGQLEFRKLPPSTVPFLLRILSRTISEMLIKEHDVLTVGNLPKIETNESRVLATLRLEDAILVLRTCAVVVVTVCACLEIVRSVGRI